MSFTEKLDAKSLEYFNEVAKRSFSDQAQFFLNAFWDECGDQAEVIYKVMWEVVKKADMLTNNVSYVHLYEEGCDLDFDMGLYYFEQSCKFFEKKENSYFKENFPRAIPSMQTSIVRKKELRDKVDVNFDGRVGFLEILLYQFQVSPKTLMERSSSKGETNPALEAARAALADVNAQIRAYEAEKTRLTELSAKPGVKGLRAKNMLAQLDAGPLAETLRMLLIKAEAAVRRASKGLKNAGPAKAGQPRTDGAVWWLQRELKTKKELYGGRKR